MRYFFIAGIFTLLFINLALPATATIIPSLDLPTLTRESSLIIIGKVIAVRGGEKVAHLWQGHSLPARKFIVEVQPSRFHKGADTGNIAKFYFIQPDIFIGYETVSANQFGMFFLKRDAGNELTVTNPYHPMVVASPEAAPLSGDALNRVISEVIGVLVSSGSSTEDKVKAVAVLDRVRVPSVSDALRQAADSPEQKLRIAVVAALLKRNDISRLDTAVKTLTDPPANMDQHLLATLAVAVEGIRNPQAIPSLTPLLNSKFPRVRQSAACALRNTGDPAAIAPLIKALYDDERRVRYQAVMGLAEITEQYSWGAAVDLYNDNEEHYLTYWRSWAKQR
ncbi:MAG: HEAT repeat domain-containing protein [Blastocatellia bacterium]